MQYAGTGQISVGCCEVDKQNCAVWRRWGIQISELGTAVLFIRNSMAQESD